MKDAWFDWRLEQKNYPAPLKPQEILVKTLVYRREGPDIIKANSKEEEELQRLMYSPLSIPHFFLNENIRETEYHRLIKIFPHPKAILLRKLLDSIYKQADRYHYIQSVNVGIEIETCVVSEPDFLASFKKEQDPTIRCGKGYRPIEFVYYREDDGGLFFTDTDFLQREQLKLGIEKIKSISTRCDNYSCGLHFHISSENLRRAELGKEKTQRFEYLLFLCWNFYFQPIFFNKFPYQLRKNGKTYARPNSYYDVPYAPLTFQYRPYMTPPKDPDDVYVHVEFRGLCPDYPRNIPDCVDGFVKEVKKMLNTIYRLMEITADTRELTLLPATESSKSLKKKQSSEISETKELLAKSQTAQAKPSPRRTCKKKIKAFST